MIVRNQLDLRREELRIRRQTLLEAHAALEEAINEEQDREAEIFEERYVFSFLFTLSHICLMYIGL